MALRGRRTNIFFKLWCLVSPWIIFKQFWITKLKTPLLQFNYLYYFNLIQTLLNILENRKSALGLGPKLFEVFWLGTTGRRRSRGLSRGLNKRVNKSQLEFHSRRLLLSRTSRATWDFYFFYPTTCCYYRWVNNFTGFIKPNKNFPMLRFIKV